jgi:hypothetical protein
MSGFLNIFFLLANFEFTKIANIANISQGGRTWRCSQRGSGEDAARAGALGRTGMITTPTRPVSTGAIPGVDPGITGGLAFLFPTGSFLFPTGALEVGDIPVVAGDQVEALGWTARDLFGLHKPAEKPHPSYKPPVPL